jgi:L-ascorbate metabolism protein UlaG (beta-lactamase superfamily)
VTTSLRTLTWLGQAGVRLGLDGVTVLVDPWGSPHEGRLVPAPPPALLDAVDLLLVTHEHLDHLDPPVVSAVLERSPAAQLVLPGAIAPLADGLVERSRIVPVDPGDVLELAGVRIAVVPAWHGVTTDDAYGDGSAVGGRPRFVGYVLGADRPVYHAGDTIVTDELVETLRPLAVGTALLPINGRDAERESRGIVGNMSADEAVELTRRVGASALVPLHWDGFAGNTVPPGGAVDAANGAVHVLVPARFERLAL